MLDEERLTSWIQSILVEPLDPEIKDWRIVFNFGKIPEKNSDEWNYLDGLGGFTSLTERLIYINVMFKFRDVNKVDDLMLSICKTLVHELWHMRQGTNIELRKQAIESRLYREPSVTALKVLLHLMYPTIFSMSEVKHVLKRKKLDRRWFLSLLFSLGLGVGANAVVEKFISYQLLAEGIFDMQIDPNHKECYEVANTRYKELIDMISCKIY